MASYPIPSWLQRYGDPAEVYLQSKHQAQALEQDRQRLAQQHEQAIMENETRQEIAAQHAREQDQQLQIDKARISAEMGLKSRQLDIAQSKATQSATAAAHRFAAQQMLSQRIAAGEDPAKAALSIPDLGIPGSGIAALAHSAAPRPNAAPVEPQQRMMTMADGTQVPYLLNPRTGATHFPRASIPQGLNESTRLRMEVQHLENQKKTFQKELADPLSGERYLNMTEADIKALKDRAPAARRRRQNAEAIHKKIDAIDEQIDSVLQGKKPAAKTGRVPVVSPTGKKGTIPEEQLQDALKAGYTDARDVDH